MWPFRSRSKRLDAMALKVVIDEQTKAIEDLGEHFRAELDHQIWRFDMMVRFYEETSGFIAPGEWGAAPLVGGGPPPGDMWVVPEPPVAPTPSMPIDAFSLPVSPIAEPPQVT